MPTRRDFLKRVCLGGVCLCGFDSLLKAGTLDQMNAMSTDVPAQEDNMPLEWIGQMLDNIGQSKLSEKQKRQLVRSASNAHYQSLGMDAVIAPYRGKLDDFIVFLEKSWGWTCTFEHQRRTLIIDEGKPYCVCPLMKNRKEGLLPALCYCSEGFEERMFSEVCGHPVKASVVASIQRGDSHCVYRIDGL